jgi:murein DD-endopeptidase MepM/ murein hydrolase activator NlpD
MKSLTALLIIFLLFPLHGESNLQWFLPVTIQCRTDLSGLQLTNIGQFGLERKARKNVPAHLHTGIDIRRPSQNYDNEKIFPACKGRVISIRDDGPFAQIIIEHPAPEGVVWTVYEHVSGIVCSVGDSVSPALSIARFFTKAELDSFGRQFDHVHFEILKQKPVEIAFNPALPQRRYTTYALTCYSYEELVRNYFDPLEFLRAALRR